jgi:hypothetical protein
MKDRPYHYKREPLTPDEANRLGSATEIATRYPVKALIGFQGRGLEDVVYPDFCHDLFLKAFIFQWP